jgi:hypothetical protein
MDFKDEDYKGILIDDITYRFDYAVRAHVELEDVVIVRLTNYESDDIQDQPANNLYVIDKNTRTIWNMKEILGDNPYFGGIYIKTHPDGRINFSEPEYPGHFHQAKVIVSDCLGYFHTIDMDTKTRIAKKRYRLDTSHTPTEINPVIAEEVDEYTILFVRHICTANAAIQPLNNIYAVDLKGKILWNIRDIIRYRDELYTWFDLVPSPSDVPYMVAYDFIGCRTTIDLKTKQIIDRVCSK